MILLPVPSGSSDRIPDSSDDLSQKWEHVRSRLFHSDSSDVIRDSAPDDMEVVKATHMRTAHYAVYRVDDNNGDSWVVRIGVTSEDDDAGTCNSGHLSTSLVTPTGQKREFEMADSLHGAGGLVCLPRHYARTSDGYDALWLPFLEGSDAPITADQWHQTLTSLYRYKPDRELPLFTNRAKTFARIDELSDVDTGAMRQTYDEQLDELFRVAGTWSVVHGDAHSGNVISTSSGEAVLYDFDTACWAPSVWDVTHLLNRAGEGDNTGYTRAELKSLFPFSDEEVVAALKLRRTAALVAKEHRQQAASRH